MIQELISTSLPKCLNGNPGFGVAAQTAGMAPNVSQAAAALSGYTHLFPAGTADNPVAMLHVIRNLGGQRRHFVSRVADAGNDYSGRSNRIGHHWIIEEPDDVHKLPCGPAAVCANTALFRTSWTDKAQELPRGKQIANVPVSAAICNAWKQAAGDAGWAAAVAEHLEKGQPVSIVYDAGSVDLMTLLREVFALLAPPIRWRTSFSTYFMKSQETPSDRIQLKCIAKGSEAEPFARSVPNTMLVNLTQPLGEMPLGKYTETARHGLKAAVVPTAALKAEPLQTGSGVSVPKSDVFDVQDVQEETYDIADESAIPIMPRFIARSRIPQKTDKRKPIFIAGAAAVVLLVGVFAAVMLNSGKKEKKMDEVASTTKTPEVKSAEANKSGEVQTTPQQGKETPSETASNSAEGNKSEPPKKDNSAAPLVAEEKPAIAPTSSVPSDDEKKKQEYNAKQDRWNGYLKDLREQKYWEKLALTADKSTDENEKEFDLKLPKKEELPDGLNTEIKIEYIPFVLSDETSVLLYGDKDPNKKTEAKIKREGNRIEFYFQTRTNLKGVAIEEIIASIDIKEGKIVFKWDIADKKEKALTDSYPMQSWAEKFNRLLLAKLKISVGEEQHTISLWEPIEYKDKGDLFRDKGINLFGLGGIADSSKSFSCRIKEENLLVDFDKILKSETNEPLPFVKSRLTEFDDKSTGWYYWSFLEKEGEQQKPLPPFSAKIEKNTPKFSPPKEKKDIKIDQFKIYLVKADGKGNDIARQIIIKEDEKEVLEKQKQDKEKEKGKKEGEKNSKTETRDKEKNEKKKKELDEEITALDSRIKSLPKEIEDKQREIENKQKEIEPLKTQLNDNLLLLLESK